MPEQNRDRKRHKNRQESAIAEWRFHRSARYTLPLKGVKEPALRSAGMRYADNCRAMNAFTISRARSVCGPGLATHSCSLFSNTVSSHTPPAAR